MQYERRKDNLPEGVRIVQCDSIEFTEKDIVYLHEWKDFLYLLSGSLIIYKCKNTYYIISPEVVFIYNGNN